MKLSKFFSKIELKNNSYAIFNSLLMDVIFVTKDELYKIEHFKTNNNDLFFDKGIYVIDDEVDDLVLSDIRKQYLRDIGKIKFCIYVLLIIVILHVSIVL